MPAEANFEQKFGQLADSQLAEKTPALVPYRVGFQIIDKNDDETKAVGVAAFIVNDVWLYVPVFFLNGDIKGLEMMYMVQKDLFVPAQDNWISMLKQQGMIPLGEVESPEENGENMSMFHAPEEVAVYTDSMSGDGVFKTASVNSNASLVSPEEWERMSTLMMGHLKQASLYDAKDLLGAHAADTLIGTLGTNVDFMNAALNFYTPQQLFSMGQKFASEEEDSPSEPAPDVNFITDPDSPEARTLEDSEKRLLLRNGVYIKDNRDNFSTVYQKEVDTGVLENPSYPGIYDVLMMDGSFRTMAILFPDSLRGRAASRGESGREIAVIDVKDPSRFIKARNMQLFVRPAVQVSREDMRLLVAGKKATMRGLRDVKKGSRLLFVNTPSNCIEVTLLDRRNDPSGGMYVAVEDPRFNDLACCDTLGSDFGSLMQSSSIIPESRNELVIEFLDRESNLTTVGRRLLVPEGTRVFINPPPKYWNPSSGNGALTGYGEYSEHPDKDIRFGDSDSVYGFMAKSAGLHTLRIGCEGNTAQILVDGKEYVGIDKIAALRTLVVEHGVQAGMAQQLIAQAERSENHTKEFLLKHAAPYDLAAYGDSTAPFMGGPAAKQDKPTQTTIVTGKGEAQTNAVPVLPQEAVEKATSAAQSGIKEVFDVSVLAALVNASDLGDLRKDFIADMIRGMDRVGRMLFLFYWHNDKFEERFGDNDLSELENTTKQVFSQTGDLILFLKEKTMADPNMSESLLDSLSGSMGGGIGGSM